MTRKWRMLEGVQFVTAPTGERTAVLIDLTRYGEVWQNFYRMLIMYQHRVFGRDIADAVTEQVDSAPQFHPYHDLDMLAGTWSAEDGTQFLAAIADFNQVDAELWQ